MITRSFLLLFVFGFFVGSFHQRILLSHTAEGTGVTGPPFQISSIPITGVSHSPEVNKQVLAGYFQLPHVTQVSLSPMRYAIEAVLLTRYVCAICRLLRPP